MILHHFPRAMNRIKSGEADACYLLTVFVLSLISADLGYKLWSTHDVGLTDSLLFAFVSVSFLGITLYEIFSTRVYTYSWLLVASSLSAVLFIKGVTVGSTYAFVAGVFGGALSLGTFLVWLAEHRQAP